MWPETIAPLRALGNGLDRTYSELMLGRLRDPVLKWTWHASQAIDRDGSCLRRPLFPVLQT